MKLYAEAVIVGELSITLYDERSGSIVAVQQYKNLVVATGKTFIASRMVASTEPVISHMSIGSSGIAASSTDTTLGTELGRVAASSVSSTNNTVTVTANFAAGTGTGTIAEAGIFNAGTAGTMVCRTTFPPVTKAAGQAIAVSWTITIL